VEVAPAEKRRDHGWKGFPLLPVLAGLAAVAAVLPLGGIVVAALSGEGADIAPRDVWRYAFASAGLTLLVGAITAVLGTTAAWLVVMYRFPGQRFFSWALALPLAAPAFALAYAYADLFDVAGPLRIWSRASLGFDLPLEMRSFPGAAFILSCAFYPYVFLAMRAAFLGQASSMLEAARVLGSTTAQALLRVALPLARPALAAGVALAMMETLADYGALQFLSVQTLTTGVIRAWSVYGSTAGAAQFALPLLGAAGLLLWLERRGRADRRFVSTASRWRTQPTAELHGPKATLAFAFCLILLVAGLLLPVGWLAWKSLGVSPEWLRLMQAGANTLALGIASALATVTLATALALGAQRMPLAARLASLGYATPGAAMAIGLAASASIVWSLFPAAASTFWAGVILLIYAYAARLMAAALEPVDAGLATVSPSIVWASRSLGRGDAATAWAVQLPIARGALFTAGLVVFIDVLKELPATLILRPFNFDTLAVLASNYALDERLPQAGWPSLLILAISVPAVIWLSGKVAASRPGQ
jgi:iron(III) transport system permease protein